MADAQSHDAPGGEKPYVGRGGLKLRHALEEFGIDARGTVCADFGCNVGGFTDCLLRAGAAKVYAVDTGYGALAWTLRQDPRVVAMERTNALHAGLPPDALRGVDLVVVDLGWTPQRLAVPAALAWLNDSPTAGVVTLIKPHYEASDAARRGKGAAPALEAGVLDDAESERVAREVFSRMPEWGATGLGLTRSPLRGGESKGNKSGNAEWLALVRRA